jgi:pimeloyl-ACP methyl ester carboxylesterase
MGPASASPELDTTIRLGDGRALAYSEWGDLAGRPVILLHGMPGSRLLCPDPEATRLAGIRLITPDRPGYGGSDPRPGRTRLTWVDDLSALMDRLAIDTCPVIGWSGGGPYALASAYRLPERVSSIALVAAEALAHETPGALDEFGTEPRATAELLRVDRLAATDHARRRNAWLTGDSWRTMFAESWGAADDELVARPTVREALETDLREAARQGAEGLVEDALARAEPDGFSAADVQQDTHIWVGREDTNMPRSYGDYLAATIPKATLTEVGGGHLFAIDHWAEILGAVP